MDWVSPGWSHLSPLPETFLTPGFLRLAFYSQAFTPMLIMRKKINDKPACHKWFENLEHTAITIFQRMEHNNMCLRIFPSSQFSLSASFHLELASSLTLSLEAQQNNKYLVFSLDNVNPKPLGRTRTQRVEILCIMTVMGIVWCVTQGMWVWHRVTESVTGTLQGCCGLSGHTDTSDKTTFFKIAR